MFQARRFLFLTKFCPCTLLIWASGQVVRALDCRAKHRWFEPNPRIKVGVLAHCSTSSKWVPGGNTGEVKGGEERNWPPYLTMPAAQDKCLSNGHSPNVRNRTRDLPLPTLLIKEPTTSHSGGRWFYKFFIRLRECTLGGRRYLIQVCGVTVKIF